MRTHFGDCDFLSWMLEQSSVFVWLSQWTHSRHSLKLTCLLRLTLSVTPCWFGVRIVPLYPPACRKRRLKGGVRSNLVVTLAAARFQGPRFYPGQGINLDRDFCSMHTPVPPLGPKHQVPEPVPSLETHLKSEQVKGRPNGSRYYRFGL